MTTILINHYLRDTNDDVDSGRTAQADIPILAVGNDEIELLEKTTDPDRDYDKRSSPPRWNVKYQLIV